MFVGTSSAREFTKRPWEPRLRQLLAMAGGIAGTGRLQAILLGGAAGTFVSPKEIDVPLTFEGTRAIGATLGSGVVMLFDDSVDLKRILLRIAAFFRHETCGQCVPCRVGVVRQQEALQRLVENRPLGSKADEIVMLREMAQAMRDASICGLGQTAASALESALPGGIYLHEHKRNHTGNSHGGAGSCAHATDTDPARTSAASSAGARTPHGGNHHRWAAGFSTGRLHHS